MYSAKIIIQGLPKTYNALRFARWQYASEKIKWRDLLTLTILQDQIKRPDRPLTKCTIDYTLFCSGKPLGNGKYQLRDRDNLVSSFKIIQDLLVYIGFISDDNCDVLKTSYSQNRCCPSCQRVEIVITEN
jgi:hypothetical protein